MFDWFSRQPAPVPAHAPSPDQPRALALYKSDLCGYCHRVMASVRELGLDVEIRDVMTDPTHRAQLRSVTGRATVPCLFIDEQPLFESRDIVAWLEAYAARDGAADAG